MVRQFSPPHLAALAVLVSLTAAWVWAVRRHPGRWMTSARLAVAALIFAAWAGEYVADGLEGIYSVRYTLPLQLTDLISVSSVAALVTRRQWLVELVYFLALSASLQATLTPDLAYDFPSIFYFTYFVYHVGAIMAACALVFGERRYPRRGAVWRAYGTAAAWAAVAGLGDVITGGNYMYLSYRPSHFSLLSLFGPWPLYILGGAAVGLAMLLVLDALAALIARADHMPRQLSARTRWPATRGSPSP
jgi:hypothetical integral membrane protein (TIGR02206 family)